MQVALLRTSIIVLLHAALFSISLSQTAPKPAVETILASAAKQRDNYIREFRNLLSQETKTFSIFDRKGEVKKRRTLVSTFIVYQFSRDEQAIAEFRNIVSVDGRKVNDSDKRAQEFFEDISKADSVGREITKLEREGTRFDEGLSINGLTLFQAPVLADNLRPNFEFSIEGGKRIDGHDLTIIRYRQIRETPYISIDPTQMVSDGKASVIYDIDIPGARGSRARLDGKLWIETNSGRLWKETRVLTVQPEGFVEPVVVADASLEYRDSGFGILTPRDIMFTQFRPAKRPEDFRKEISVRFEYANFTKPDVEVKEAEVKN
jgi:hypothetical protein